ncbi:hypothetical protein I316_00893 [Kwoniella heveanensis BCC8398]|uniref:Bromodomain associated domain-containing protein n=1 Tax=Kwoniella heveanensis BCC8398 TaxID=1296120 RepID=A0A1B9H3C2_9TREE|nr:hypothetical protein I316_00893 [Kwoniella heveanensis BCC8398]
MIDPTHSAPASPSPAAVLHLAALHTLAATGFASTSSAASLTLSSVLEKYLKLVATTCVERANSAGRNKVAAVDIVAALDDLGVRVGELVDWAEEVDEGRNAGHLGKDGLGGLEGEAILCFDHMVSEWLADELLGSTSSEYLHDGLSVDQSLARMRLVPEDELEPEQEQDSSADNVELEDDESMDIDRDQYENGKRMQDTNVKAGVNGDPESLVKTEPPDDIHQETELGRIPTLYPFVRHRSPDMSWLPPLPSATSNQTSTQGPITAANSTELALPNNISSGAPMPVPVPLPEAQSIADRYRRPIPYSSSQLSQAHPFHDPPKPSSPLTLPPAPTSLPNLISTYAAIANDPSIALRQIDVRRQASELLRHSIAPVDAYTPAPTLISPIPPVRASPIVPSHSEDMPAKLLPVNPRPNGLLSSLVHQIQSPHLPPALRERLTSLRPPVPLKRDDQLILYGDGVRGPDEGVLLKAKGKHVEEGSVQEIYLRQTWDSGPRGMEKWSRGRLPTGRKVVQSKEGELLPREEEGKRKEREQTKEAKVRLKLPSFGSGEGLIPPPSQTPVEQGKAASSSPGMSPGAGGAANGGTSPGIRLKLGGNKLTTPVSERPPPIQT